MCHNSHCSSSRSLYGFLSTNCGEYSIANDGLQYAAAGPKPLTLARRHANIVDELHAQYTDADGETV